MKNKIFTNTDENKFAREVLPKQSGLFLVKGSIKLDDTHRSPSNETFLVILTAGESWEHSLVICSQGAFFDDVKVWDIEDGAITEDKLASQSVTTAKIKDGAVTKEKLAPGVIDGGGGIIMIDAPISGIVRQPEELLEDVFGDPFDNSRVLTHNILFRFKLRLSTDELGDDLGIGIPISNYLPPKTAANPSNSFGFFYVLFRGITSYTPLTLNAGQSILKVGFTKMGGRLVIRTDTARLGYGGILNLLADNQDGTSLVHFKEELEVGKAYPLSVLGTIAGTPPFISTGKELYRLVPHITEAQAEALANAVNEKFGPTTPVTPENLQAVYAISSGAGNKTMVGDKIETFGIARFNDVNYILA